MKTTASSSAPTTSSPAVALAFSPLPFLPLLPLLSWFGCAVDGHQSGGGAMERKLGAPGRGFSSQSFGHGMDERRMGIKGDRGASLHPTVASGCVGAVQGDKVMPRA